MKKTLHEVKPTFDDKANRIKSKDFQKELEGLLNRYSYDDLCNVPDFILAALLTENLHALADALDCNEAWHGRKAFAREENPNGV